MKKLAVLAVLVVALSGCSSFERVPAKVTEHKTPKVNSENSVSLGESMLESGMMITKESFTLYSDVSTSDGTDIVSGEFVLNGIDGADAMFNRVDGGVTTKSLLGTPYMFPIYIDGKTGEVCFCWVIWD